MGLDRNRFVTALVTLVGAAVIAVLFPFNRTAESYNQYIVGNLIGLFWIPMLTILFLSREDPVRFGFTLGGSRKLWLAVGALFVGLLILMVPVSRWAVFQDYYPIFRRYPEFARAFARYPAVSPWSEEPWLMVFAEVSYGMYLFCWEFFFRGYVLFGLVRSIGWPAIIVQAAAFALLHIGKPIPEVAASFGAGIILGIMALNAKSFVPCFVLHWAASVAFDFLVVASRA
ncbi:MAG: CPBP family intramembrane metalloprotease [Armatimonadetes bacterium]|nr:CPBP family intramembrane metalloprotease [Armatimonadota bacterium]